MHHKMFLLQSSVRLHEIVSLQLIVSRGFVVNLQAQNVLYISGIEHPTMDGVVSQLMGAEQMQELKNQMYLGSQVVTHGIVPNATRTGHFVVVPNLVKGSNPVDGVALLREALLTCENQGMTEVNVVMVGLHFWEWEKGYGTKALGQGLEGWAQNSRHLKKLTVFVDAQQFTTLQKDLGKS